MTLISVKKEIVSVVVMTKNHVRPNAHQHTRGDIALRNFNETTQKYKRWVDRWYYNLGVLTCRICNNSIRDKSNVCLYDGKVIHVECMGRKGYKQPPH